MDVLRTPLGITAIVAVILVVVAALVVRRIRRGPRRRAPSTPRDVDAAAQRGDFAGAARLALRDGLLGEALGYYVRAHLPGEAAKIAVRMGRHQRAAELFEEAGNTERAAHFYEKCGMAGKAAELRPAAAAPEPADSHVEIVSAAASAAAALRSALPVTGLERAAVKLDLLWDSAVRAARSGPSLEVLADETAGVLCRHEGADQHYRLGLAQLAAGRWTDALATLEAVDAGAPGRTDARARADAVAAWVDALGERASLGERYRIVGELRRGNAVVVYRAEDRERERDVVIEVLPADLSSTPELCEEFDDQARAIAELDHPRIVPIFDHGVIDGRPYVCAELVDGRTVADLAAADAELDVQTVTGIARDVLDALAYAHSCGVVHRDLEPAKLVRTAGGELMVADFGFAALLDASNTASVVAGTPAYMAPEQLAEDPVDHRADLFALGVVLYELLTGQLPFEGLDRDRAPTPVREHAAAISPALDAAVMRALEVDPARRYESARAMADALAAI